MTDDQTNTIGATQAEPTSQATAARAYLVVHLPGGTQLIDIDDGTDVLFGRSPEATVCLDDAKASREHARFVRRGGTLEVIDLGSRNGTRVNDQTLRGQALALRSGDVVRIGGVDVLIAESAGVAQRAAGRRLPAELARVRAENLGRATLLRLPLTSAALARLAGLLAGARLVEAQADGAYACLLDPADHPTATAWLAAARQLLPELSAAVVQAPDDGDTVDELWRRAGTTADKARPTTAPAAPPGVVVCDPAMRQVFERVRKVAATPTTVLILGETGVGKEVIAEQIHQQSPRAQGPFIRLNCGSLPETLLESELFGHERGAFTGADRRKQGYIEAASGGTLLLDEIGELGLSMQTRLLRVLEERTFMRVGGREAIASDLRVLAASNRNLEAEARAGRFRQDLYFRLSAFVIQVPPLRERRSEIELLSGLFVRQFAARLDRAAPILASDTLAVLAAYPWPGNVRELRNAMEHAVVLADGGVVSPEHLPDSLRAPAAPPAPSPGAMPAQVAELERRSIQEALDAENGNQTRAARRLGISRRALLYKLERHGLKR